MRWAILVILVWAASPLARGEENAPKVTAIHPSTDCIPANLLRFYLTFNEPMARGDIDRSISIENSNGETIASPFLNIRAELWTADQTTITLLLDPGRIKRGVGPNVMGGAPLSAGKRYSLVVSAPLRAAASGKEIEISRKDFCVSEAERRPLDLANWLVEGVRARTTDPLIVSFDRLMDYGSASGRIAIESNDGRPVAGSFRFGPDDRSIEFWPSLPWEASSYEIVADEALEDAAGNRLSASFDSSPGEYRGKSTVNRIRFIPENGR